MSSIDRLANLARGAWSSGQKQFEVEGGIEGAARRVGERVRRVAESTRTAVSEGIGGLGDADEPPLVDPALEAARREVADLKAPLPTPAATTATGASRPMESSELASELAAVDAQHRAGTLSRVDWEAARARILDAHDRANTRSEPRRRTL